MGRRRTRLVLSNKEERALASPVEPVEDGYGGSIDPRILASLSPAELRYVIWEVTPDWFKAPDKRTLVSIAEELHVSVPTLYVWRHTPHIVRAFAVFGLYVVKSGIADRQVFENLVALTATDTKAQETYWKLRGALNDNPNIEHYPVTIDARQITINSKEALDSFRKSLPDYKTND